MTLFIEEEFEPKQIFSCRRNVELTIPFKKRLNTYRYEDFLPKTDEPKKIENVGKKNLRPRNSIDGKLQFTPTPYEKPITRRQTRKSSSDQSPKPEPAAKRRRKSGKENQLNSVNQMENQPTTSKTDKDDLSIAKNNSRQISPKNELNNSRGIMDQVGIEGDDLLALFQMFSKNESNISTTNANTSIEQYEFNKSMQSSQNGTESDETDSQPSTSSSDSKAKPPKKSTKSKKPKVKPLKISLVSPGLVMHNQTLML